MSDVNRDALAGILEDVEYESCYAIASAIIANRAAVLRALGLRVVSDWENATDE